MKKAFSIILLLFFFVGIAQQSYAQTEMSKKELKALKKSIKRKFVKNPEAYKKMIDNYNERIEELENKLAQTERSLNAAQKAREECTKSNEELVAQMEEMETKIEEMSKQPAAATTSMPSGIAYSVQIGYYEHFDISGYFATPRIMGVEKVEGGNKYIVGYFTDMAEAEQFAADMRSLGISDAFVVGYRDGVRADKNTLGSDPTPVEAPEEMEEVEEPW